MSCISDWFRDLTGAGWIGLGVCTYMATTLVVISIHSILT